MRQAPVFLDALLHRDLVVHRQVSGLSPRFYDLVQLHVDIQQHLREADPRLFQRKERFCQLLPDVLHIQRRLHVASIVEAVPSGSSGDLTDLLRLQFPVVRPVELHRVHKDDAPDRKIDPHADRIRRDDHLVDALRKEAHLLLSGLRRQVSIDHAGVDPAVFQLGGDRQHVLLGKGDQRVPLLDVGVDVVSLRQEFQLRISLMVHRLEGVPASADHGLQKLLGGSGAAYVDLFRTDSEDCPRPVASAVFIRHHLRLVDHGDVIQLPDIENLHRGSLYKAPRRADRFLSGDHAARYAGRHHPLIHLQRQKPERSQIDPAVCLSEPLQRLVGLSAVGRSDMEDKVPLHSPCLRVLLLRLRAHQLFDPLSDQILHIVFPVDLIQGFLPQKLRRLFHRHDVLRVRSRRHPFEEPDVQTDQRVQGMLILLHQAGISDCHRVAERRGTLVKFLHVRQNLVILLVLLARDPSLKLVDLLLTALHQLSPVAGFKFQKGFPVNLADALRDLLCLLFFFLSLLLCLFHLLLSPPHRHDFFFSFISGRSFL